MLQTRNSVPIKQQRPPFLCPPAPGDHRSTCRLPELDGAGCLARTEPCSICPLWLADSTKCNVSQVYPHCSRPWNCLPCERGLIFHSADLPHSVHLRIVGGWLRSSGCGGRCRCECGPPYFRGGSPGFPLDLGTGTSNWFPRCSSGHPGPPGRGLRRFLSFLPETLTFSCFLLSDMWPQSLGKKVLVQAGLGLRSA